MDNQDALRLAQMCDFAADTMAQHTTAPMPPRELLCMRCGVEHPVWAASNELWNAVLRRPDGSDEFPFVCPTCFTILAAERGVATAFKLVEMEV